MKRSHISFCVLVATFLLGLWLVGVQSGLGLEIKAQVDLNPDFDQFGSQIPTVQIYEDASGEKSSAFGIYDTGCSVVTWSAYDQFISPVPIKVFDGAEAEGIGGTLTGDVSQPGKVLVAGMHAVDFLTLEYDPSKAAFAPGDPAEHGVQLFVGKSIGSPDLPTITGTPIHNGRLVSDPAAQNGVAAKIGMQWGLDLGALVEELIGDIDPAMADSFEGIFWPMPNVEFVAPNSKLTQIPNDDDTPLIDESTTAPVRIPLALYGEDNHDDPGDMITASYNPFQKTGVVLSDGGATIGDDPNDRLAMLVDTGAALSIVSTQMAIDLGFDPESSTPEFSVEVQGAAGGIGSIKGFTIDSLELPVDDDGIDGPDGKVLFTNVPVFVYDVMPADTDPEEGLDGILGMNLFNYAYEMLYDPFDDLGPSLSLTFLNDPYQEVLDPGLLEDLGDLGLLFPQSALSIPGVRGGAEPVPEPSTWVLLATGGALLLCWRLRRRRAA